MLEPATYAAGSDLGFEGVSFYLAGRAGMLGEVDADVVAAGLVFWEPGMVRASWELVPRVMAPADGAARFAECGHAWGRERIPSSIDLATLAALAGRVITEASCSGAPLFAGWRLMAEPDPDDTAALVLHRLNALRELRMALHGCAVLGVGLRPVEAMAVRAPQMMPLFGWTDPPVDPEPLRAAWETAEEATNRALGHAFECLDEDERETFVSLCDAVHTATS